MTVAARDVAAVLRERIPGLPVKKMHKLLYYVQGHHLATFGVRLFQEDLVAFDRGPIVESLWREEKYGFPPGKPESPGGPLTEAELNTIGYVMSRYGALTGGDLENLSHAEDPWRLADARRGGAGRSAVIEPGWLVDWFGGAAMHDEDEQQYSAHALEEFLSNAEPPNVRPREPDNIASLYDFVREYEPRNGPAE